MDKLTRFIERHISGKKVLLLFILTNIVYTIMLTVTIPGTMAFSNGMKLLDMMPMGYNFNYVNELFNALGENGREAYLTNQIPIDMVYPLLFGLSYCLLLGYFLKKLSKLHKLYSYLCLLPIIAGSFDYFENLGIIAMINNYPNLTEVLVRSTNIFTIIKSVSTTLFFVTLIIVLIALGLSTIRAKN